MISFSFRGYSWPRDWTWVSYVSCLGRQGNGNPPQYSCLKNSMDRGARWAAVHGVSKSQTWLNDYTFFTTSTTWEAPSYCLHTSKSTVLISSFWILPLIELALHLELCHPWLQFFPDREGHPDGKSGMLGPWNLTDHIELPKENWPDEFWFNWESLIDLIFGGWCQNVRICCVPSAHQDGPAFHLQEAWTPWHDFLLFW